MTLREYLGTRESSIFETTNYGMVSASELLAGCRASFMDDPVRVFTKLNYLEEIQIDQGDAFHYWQERERPGIITRRGSRYK